jgi:hypothetical protein
MEKVRIHWISRIFMGFALAGLAVGCGEDAAGPSKPSTITEADVTGVWRTSVPAPGFTVKVVMNISADHSIDFSTKYAGVIPGKPDSLQDRADEAGTWSLNNGVMRLTKTDCKYATAPDYHLKDSTCVAPLIKDYSLGLKGNSMTVVEGTGTFVFTKD